MGLLDPKATIHVHLWTDSTAALGWLRKHRDANPLVSFCVQYYSHLQTVMGEEIVPPMDTVWGGK